MQIRNTLVKSSQLWGMQVCPLTGASARVYASVFISNAILLAAYCFHRKAAMLASLRVICAFVWYVWGVVEPPSWSTA
jgi:hypothetical protein